MANYKLVNADQLDSDLLTVANAIRARNGTSAKLAFPAGMKSAISAISDLNFTVVGGTTAPSSPKENTIWVNTSTDITSYVFSATQPTGSAGMVWIYTGTSSVGAFNALKKNTIQVYPIYAKQYISGAWVDKTTKIYQNSGWIELISRMYIFDNGQVVCPDVGNIITAGNAKLIVEITGSSSFDKTSAFTFENKTNIGNYTKLLVEVKQPTFSSELYGLSLGFANSNDIEYANWQGAENLINGNAKIHIGSTFDEYQVFELDISAYSGTSMYIVGNGVADYYVKRIWLSK